MRSLNTFAEWGERSLRGGTVLMRGRRCGGLSGGNSCGQGVKVKEGGWTDAFGGNDNDLKKE